MLRVIDSFSKKSEKFRAKENQELAKYFDEYIGRNAGLNPQEARRLKQIAKQFSNEDLRIQKNVKRLTTPKNLKSKRGKKLTPAERRALRDERRFLGQKNIVQLRDRYRERKLARVKYLRMLYNSLSVDTLNRVHDFLESKIQVKTVVLDDNQISGINNTDSSSFSSSFFSKISYKKPLAGFLPIGTMDIYAISNIHYAASVGAISANAETFGFCSYNDEGGFLEPYDPGFGDGLYGEGGGGVSISFQSGGGDNVCDYLSVEMNMYPIDVGNGTTSELTTKRDDTYNEQGDGFAQVWASRYAYRTGTYCIVIWSSFSEHENLSFSSIFILQPIGLGC